MSQREAARTAGRNKVLAAALEEFLELGFAGASTRSIARRAGMAQSSLFHHFSSKQDIHDALLELGRSHLDTQLSGPAVAESVDPDTHVAAVVIQSLEMLRASPDSARMFLFMSRAQMRGDSSVAASGRAIRESLTAAIAAGQRTDLFRPGDPAALAAALLGALQGAAEMRVTEPTIDIPEASWLLDIVRN